MAKMLVIPAQLAATEHYEQFAFNMDNILCIRSTFGGEAFFALTNGTEYWFPDPWKAQFSDVIEAAHNV